MEDDRTLDVVDAADRIAFLVCLWVTTADEHHTDGSTGIELNRAHVEVACCYTFKEVDDVTLQAQHDALGLRITHTAVIFYHHRFTLDVDESKEDEAFIVDVFSGETFYGGTDNAVLDLLHPLLCGKGNRCHAAHTSGIQTSIVLADALVVLGLRQNLVVLAVGENED